MYLRAAFIRHMSGAGALGVDVVGPDSTLARLAALNKRLHAVSTNVREASVSLSLGQRRVLDEPTMKALATPRAHDKANSQQLLESIDLHTRARVTSLMQDEYNLRQEWFAMHAVFVDSRWHERRACQTEMRAEVAYLDKALSVEGIMQIIGESGREDIRKTLTLIGTRRTRVKRQYIRSCYNCSKPMAIIDALYSLREAQYQGMCITSDRWRMYEEYAHAAASDLKDWQMRARANISDGSSWDCRDSDHSGCERCCGQSDDDGDHIWECETQSDDDGDHIWECETQSDDDGGHIWECETQSDDEAAGSASERCECV